MRALSSRLHFASAGRALAMIAVLDLAVTSARGTLPPASAVSCGASTPAVTAVPPAGISGVKQPTAVSMRNVDFRLTARVVMHIRRLDGEMHPMKSSVVDFDDKESYVTDIRAALVGLAGDDLTHLMNDCVFAYPGAPLRDLRVSTNGRLLHQSGVMHKGVDIPFSLDAEPSLTSDGYIRLHPVSMKIFGVNGQVLMRVFHLSLQGLLDLSRARGVRADGNDLLLDPIAILPPPTIRGRVSALRIEGNELVQQFGAASDTLPANVPPDSAAHNYMYYHGGTLHFGKLFMSDADMLVVDQDQRDPFDFDNDHYQRQLIAGYSRTLPSLGLEVYMPDAAKVSSPASVGGDHH